LGLGVLLLSLFVATAGFAQEATAPAEPDRSATGGAQTLEDILARQRGEPVDDSFRSTLTGDPDSAAGIAEQLGTLGGASDPDLWRALRYGSADITSSAHGPAATVLVQDGGMRWLTFREGPLIKYGGYLLLGTLVLLALFFLIRGRIRIDGEKTGRTIERFFIAVGSKWVHNNVSWAFILGLIMIFVMWVVHNLPDRTDLVWIAKGGGIFTKGHPPAKKFNAGQKLIFWSVILLGTSISVTGLALLFPFEINLFAATFAKLNSFGISALLGLGELPTVLAPHEEMQLSQLWHAIVSFVLMAIIFAHIYIGSIGMEGAYDAMGTGHVEEQWANEHHSIWAEEAKTKEGRAPDGATPAE